MHLSKQISTREDNFIKIYRAFRILGLNDYEKIYIRTYLFYLGGNWRVYAVTKLLQITLFSTVIMN